MKERIVLLKPEEQAFGQCEVLEVGIEDLVRLFCCSVFLGHKNIGDWEMRIPLFSHWWNPCVDVI